MRPDDILRAALEARAARVEVAPDALPVIRARIAARRTRRQRGWTVGLASLATGAAATVAAVALGLGGCLPQHPPRPPATGPAPTTPATTPSATPSPTGSATPAGTVRAPVYLVGTAAGAVPARRVLYWEYHQVPAGSLETRIAGALGVALAGPATDPDYATAWPAGVTVRSVTLTADAIEVDLAGAAAAPADPDTARIAIQQLVYTATGVAADQGVNRSGVRLRFDGATRATPWGGVPVAGTLTRAPAAETLAPVWLLSPQEGNVVGGSFDVHIAGSVFEAAVRLRVRDARGEVVDDRGLTLDAGAPARGELHTTLTLAPGEYTLEAFFTTEPLGGEAGTDSHHITVR